MRFISDRAVVLAELQMRDCSIRLLTLDEAFVMPY